MGILCDWGAHLHGGALLHFWHVGRRRFDETASGRVLARTKECGCVQTWSGMIDLRIEAESWQGFAVRLK